MDKICLGRAYYNVINGNTTIGINHKLSQLKTIYTITQ